MQIAKIIGNYLNTQIVLPFATNIIKKERNRNQSGVGSQQPMNRVKPRHSSPQMSDGCLPTMLSRVEDFLRTLSPQDAISPLEYWIRQEFPKTSSVVLTVDVKNVCRIISRVQLLTNFFPCIEPRKYRFRYSIDIRTTAHTKQALSSHKL